MGFRAVEADAEALKLLRQLLWVDSLYATQAEGCSPGHQAVRTRPDRPWQRRQVRGDTQ